MTGIVDSHAHFWDRERFHYAWLDDVPSLQSNFLPAELLEQNNSIEAIVAVEADRLPDQALAEAEWFQQLRDEGAPIVAIVAQAPLETDCRDHLAQLADMPLVTGVRRLLQSEPLGFALSDDFVAGVRLLENYSLSLDLCIRHEQLSEAVALVRQCQDVRFVLDHFGKPQPVPSAFDSWARDLEALASEPNVWCKLSGLASEAPPERRSSWALQPWLAHALEVFGPERCMFGSDWPVLTTVSSYADWVHIVESALEGQLEDRDAVFSDTALAFYAPALERQSASDSRPHRGG